MGEGCWSDVVQSVCVSECVSVSMCVCVVVGGGGFPAHLGSLTADQSHQ